jgi:hypothetical protein
VGEISVAEWWERRMGREVDGEDEEGKVKMMWVDG